MKHYNLTLVELLQKAQPGDKVIFSEDLNSNCGIITKDINGNIQILLEAVDSNKYAALYTNYTYTLVTTTKIKLLAFMEENNGNIVYCKLDWLTNKYEFPEQYGTDYGYVRVPELDKEVEIES